MRKIFEILFISLIAIGTCVSCEKDEIPEDPHEVRIPTLREGLISEIKVPIEIIGIKVEDYNNTKEIIVEFNNKNYDKESDNYNKICESYSIDNTVPYQMYDPYKNGLTVLGGEVNNLTLKCKVDFNSKFTAGSDFMSQIQMYYGSITTQLYDYKSLKWKKTDEGSGWSFFCPDIIKLVNNNDFSMLLPIWDDKYPLYLKEEPEKPGTYDFILSMTVYSPIYGEKTMEKEFSMTWE